MPSSDLVRRVTTLIALMLLMMPIRAFAQESATPQQANAPGAAGARGQAAGGGAGRGGAAAGPARAYGDGQRLEGKAITVDHAMRTMIPEPARDNAFSMTVSTYGITATLRERWRRRRGRRSWRRAAM